MTTMRTMTTMTATAPDHSPQTSFHVASGSSSEPGQTYEVTPLELFLAWLQDFRKVVVRYERHDYDFAGFVKLGCIVILLRACF